MTLTLERTKLKLDLNDHAALRREYVDFHGSLDHLAQLADTTPARVRGALLRAGIPIRHRGHPERAITDMCARRRLDHKRKVSPDILEARIRAVFDAQLHHQPYALRDALIDLAATCLDAADQLPAPTGRLPLGAAS